MEEATKCNRTFASSARKRNGIAFFGGIRVERIWKMKTEESAMRRIDFNTRLEKKGAFSMCKSKWDGTNNGGTDTDCKRYQLTLRTGENARSRKRQTVFVVCIPPEKLGPAEGTVKYHGRWTPPRESCLAHAIVCSAIGVCRRC